MSQLKWHVGPRRRGPQNPKPIGFVLQGLQAWTALVAADLQPVLPFQLEATASSILPAELHFGWLARARLVLRGRNPSLW